LTSPVPPASLSFTLALQRGVRVMLHLVEVNRSYSPETVALMKAAFDAVWQSVSNRMNGSDDVKKTLALIILRHVDHGERDAKRLADAALREWTGSDRAAIGARSATG
jgi:hypothetical protein